MNESEYRAICDFVSRRSGITLGDSKSYLVESRLGPIAESFEFEDIGDMSRHLPTAKPEVGDAIIDAMTTNESFFFRDKTPFELFQNVILPKLVAEHKSTGRIRIWCAAASTGQEPYSLAMILLANRALWAGCEIEIIATDISPSALKRAREGKYTQFEIQRGLPIELLVEYFTQEGTSWVISDAVKKMVRFQQMNLIEPLTGIGAGIDLVFCRNVLIYFEAETKRKVLDSIYGTMRKNGYLVLGAAETLIAVSEMFERADGQRGLYQPVSSAAKDTALRA